MTTTRYEGPVSAGMVFRHDHYTNWRITNGEAGCSSTVEFIRRNGWQPVETTATPATTAPVERRLADGWEVVRDEDTWECTDIDGNAATIHPHGRLRAKWKRRSGWAGACEACAPSMGVFAGEPADIVVQHHVEDLSVANGEWNAPAGWSQYTVGAWHTDPRNPAVERWYVGMDFGIEKDRKPIVTAMAPKPCARCTHTHQGPCDGRSPFGEFSCPCGHEKAEKAVRVVGKYDQSEILDRAKGSYMGRRDKTYGATATLLANLAREKVPPRREVKQVARYADGASLDWWEL